MPIKTTITFTDDMLAAVLDGKKTVTRRIIKPQPDTTEDYLRKHSAWDEDLSLSDHVNNAWRSGFIDVECPYGNVGDMLSVDSPGIVASLEITDVRVEQLHMISLGQIVKEGLAESIYEFTPMTQAFPVFEQLWDSIYGVGSWAANPWVWVIEFKRVQSA